MATKSSNTSLHQASRAKKDEFYTQLADIENELKHYKEQFRNKVVYCNCDDPFESNFFKYFAASFNALGLKKLITTSYNKSPIAGKQLPLFEIEGMKSIKPKDSEAHRIEINEVPDINNDGSISLEDVKQLLMHDKNTATPLRGNGDFRSDECVELLKEADIVVTNPPFSLFREYITQLLTHDKKFLIIGNVNAVTYKECFQYIKDNKIWLGASIHSGDREFRVPDDYPLEAAGYRVDNSGNKYIRVKGVRWFTNLDYEERHEKLVLYKRYKPEEYPRYENYDAININQSADIPVDYFDVMGVPITFLDKYDPEQFEIIGMTKTPVGTHLRTKEFPRQIQIGKNGKESNVTKLNDGAALKVTVPPVDKTYYIVDGEYYIAVYPRILIKPKEKK
jgi:hypothetical protein